MERQPDWTLADLGSLLGTESPDGWTAHTVASVQNAAYDNPADPVLGTGRPTDTVVLLNVDEARSIVVMPDSRPGSTELVAKLAVLPDPGAMSPALTWVQSMRVDRMMPIVPTAEYILAVLVELDGGPA